MNGRIGLIASEQLSMQAEFDHEALLTNIKARNAEVQALLVENEIMIKKLKLRQYELIREGDFHSKTVYPSTQIFFNSVCENAGKGKDNSKSEWSNTLPHIRHKVGGGQVPKGKNPYGAGELRVDIMDSLKPVAYRLFDKDINGNIGSFQSNVSNSEAMHLLSQGNEVYIHQPPYELVLELGERFIPEFTDLPYVDKKINFHVDAPRVPTILQSKLAEVTISTVPIGITLTSVTVNVPNGGKTISMIAPTISSLTEPTEKKMSVPNVTAPEEIVPTMIIPPAVPENPKVIVPTNFLPPTIVFKGTGFAQDAFIRMDKNEIIMENYDDYTTDSTVYIETGINGTKWYGGKITASTKTPAHSWYNPNGPRTDYLMPGNTATFLNAFINELRDHNAIINGEYKMSDLGGGNNTKIFMSHNPAAVGGKEAWPGGPAQYGGEDRAGERRAKFIGKLELVGIPTPNSLNVLNINCGIIIVILEPIQY